MRLFVLLLLLSLPALARTAEHTLLEAAALLDVESGEVLAEPRVLVSDGRIAAINPAEVPAGTEVVKLPGMTLLPGFIDAHVHLAISDSNFHPTITSENGAMATLRAVESARQTLLGGFTTVRDLSQVNPSPDLIVVALDRAIEQGRVIGPDIVACGHSIGISGGHVDVTMGTAEGRFELDWRYGIADGAEEVLKATRHQIKYGAAVIKISATAGVLSPEPSVGAQQMTEAEMRAVVEEAARHGIKVAAHAHGSVGIKAAVEAGVASIEHGSMIDRDSMRLMKKRGTYLVPTTGLLETIELDLLPPVMQDKARHILPLAAKNLVEAIKYGVPIALGTDAPLIAHGKNAYEFEAMVARGMSPLDSIRAGTVNGAELLGTSDRGRLKAGLRADIVAVPGNPLDDITLLQRVAFVMKEGKVYRSP
jgi:imidazolonepropionase-like amidohydrolase